MTASRAGWALLLENGVVSVKATNNPAIPGTGGRITIFDRGIHKFLDTCSELRFRG